MDGIMSNLSELTLVMPTYNRQKYALRQMHFWSGFSVTLYALDGTSEPILTKNLSAVGDNVHYYNMPHSYEERMGKAVELVDTPYVALLYDDEFLIPSALDHCIEALKQNKDFVACVGGCLGFHSSKKGISGKKLNIDKKNLKINGTTANERMIASVTPYACSTFCAVQHSAVWKKSMEIVSKYNFSHSCPYLQELQFQLASYYQGKSMVINELMWLRNLENDGIDFDKWNRKIPIGKWMKNIRNANEVKIFYETTAGELAKIDGADKEKILAELIKLDTESYWMRWAADSPKELLRNRLLGLLPKKSKRILEQLNVNCRWRRIVDEAEKMQEAGVNVDMMQLKKIVEYMETNL
jgi:glycosyltransferase domain-containing protein